jgi:hypothetical protein
MAKKTTNLTVNESAYGRTGFFQFDFNDLQTTGFLSTGASGLMGAANQLVLDVVEPGEMIEHITVTCITAAVGDTDFVIDVGTGNDSNTDPDNLIDNTVLGDNAANTSIVGGLTITGHNSTASNVGLLIEFSSLTAENLTAGEWIIAWKKVKSPLAYAS